MLLSSGNSPDTRCSLKLPEVRTNERVSSRNLPSQEELDPPILGERTPNFSIRDYVFASRRQGIEAAWPFAPQFLKFCLKHGVKELLPPFEHPDILRANCLSKLEAVTQPTAGLEAETVSSNLDIITPIIGDQSDEDPSSVPKDSGLALKEPVLTPSIHPSPKETKSTSNCELFVNELSHSDAGIPSTSRTSQQTEEILSQNGNPLSVSLDRYTTTRSQPEVSDPTCALEKPCEPLAKRNRLIVKLASTSETRQTEDAVQNSGMILHPMASKVCPVCKIFSFTSNTTLNAHIDQCLSMESNSKGLQNNVSIYKVKPKKKRLMVDIYASSHCCTLEDLDKRNGTNWSSEMAIMTMPTNGVDVLTTRQVSPIHSECDRTEPVYVDSHGIKLRILSKLNEQVSHEKFKLRKQAKESKAREALSINKKKQFASKYTKLKKQNEKCFSSNFMKSQIHATDKLDCNTENHQKNGKYLTHVSKPEEKDKIITFATVKQWACAKRSKVRKKLAIEDNCGTSEDMVPSNMNVQPDSGNSPDIKTQAKTSSRSSEELTGSSKHGSMELPQPNSIHSEDLTITNSLVLKLSRLSGSFTCSSVLKLKEKDEEIRERFNSASNRKTVMLKSQRGSDSNDNDTTKWKLCIEGRKVGAIEKPSISKKLWKYRTLARTVPKEELPPLSNAGSSSPTGYDSLLRGDGKETTGSNQCSTHRNNTMFGEGAMNDLIAQHPKIIEYQENNNSTNLSSQTQFHGTEIETSSMQMEISESRDDTTNSSKEKTTVPVVHDSVNSEKVAPPLGAELDSCQSEEHASEAHLEQFKQHFKYQEKFQGDSNSNEIGDRQIKLAEVRGQKDSHLVQPGQDQADTLSLQESSGCLTCHNDEPERSSSINSIRITASHSNNVSTDREPSGSPISTASTVSLPSPSDFKFQGTEKLSRATSVNGYQISVIHSAKSLEVAQERNLEDIEHETKDSMPDKELHQCEDDNCLCGSCRENIDKDSILFRQNGSDRTTTSKLVSDLSIGPRNSSCFTVYQNCNDNMINNSEAGPPKKLTLLKSSPDSSVNFPTCSNSCSPRPSIQSQNHSVSSPMLRLMGKNLLVQNCEVVQSQPLFNSTQPVNLSGSKYELTDKHTKQGNFQYQHNHLVPRRPRTLCQTVPPVDHQIPLNLPRRPIGSGFTWAPVQPGCTAKLNQQIQQWQLHKDPCLSHQIMDQVIVIDDPWHENDARGFLTSSASNFPPNSVHHPLPQTTFSCYPLQNQMVEHVRPLFPNVYSSASTSFMNQKITSENQGPFVPNPTLFQSLPGQRTPVAYYSRNLHWS